MAVTLVDTIVRRDGLFSTDVSGRQVILNPQGEYYVGLDAIGSKIWERIESPMPVARLCEELVAAYEGERASIEGDLLRFLDGILAQKLIVQI